MLIPLGFLASSGGVAGDFVLLETQVLGSAEANVTFSGLSAYASDYKHLQVRVAARSSATGHVIGLRLRLGTTSIDEGANYSNHQLYGLNGSVGSGGFANTSFMFASAIAGASAPASAFGAVLIDLLDPFETTKNKTSRALGGYAGSSSTDQAFIGLESGSWRNTSAVGQLRLILASGNFVENSRFSLYGIRG